jgi:hypothetical protein
MTAIVVLILRIGLAVVLYFFLWQIFRTLWLELKQQSSILSSRRKPRISLELKKADGSRSNYHFQQDEILIGRSSQCDISIQDEALSMNHARLSHHHSHWWVEDSGSTNSTFLNKDLVTVPTIVIAGDEFKCGNSTFIIRTDHTNETTPTKQLN